MLSHKPLANLARVLAEAGAMTMASAQRPSSTWLFQLDSETTSLKRGGLTCYVFLFTAEAQRRGGFDNQPVMTLRLCVSAVKKYLRDQPLYTIRIAGEEENILRIALRATGDYGVFNVVDRVGDPRVFGNAAVGIIDGAGAGQELNVL
jgi:hypothetical protein